MALRSFLHSTWKALAIVGLIAVSVHTCTTAHAQGVARSVGSGEGRLVGGDAPTGDCFGAPLLLNSDSTYENGYAWDYGGVQLPYYGAFAECYSGNGAVCALVLDLTTLGAKLGRTLDAYVWADDGGIPGAVAAVRTGVVPGAIAYWPSVSRHEVSISALIDGPTWVGYWGDWPFGVAEWFVGADLDGEPGCASTNIVPGFGYPDTGWQNVSVVWGPTHALGIGLRLTDDLPGACCFPDGACSLTNVDLCDGEYLGDGISCEPNPCPQPPLGACCLPDLSCVIQSEYECDMEEGFYFGDESVCEGTDCFTPCPPLLTDVYVPGQPGRGPNANGILFLHSDPSVVYSQGTDYCGADLINCFEANARVETPDPVVFHAIAEFPAGQSPRLAGITFGVSYADCFVLLESGSCGDFELPTSDWPASGEGTAVTWLEAQETSTTESYWFAGYVTEDQATVFDLVPHPIQGATFADDDIPSNLDPISGLGSLGFRTDGDLPCFQDAPGACCFSNGDCEMLGSDEECEGSGGAWQGYGTICDPNPCEPVPTVERSWGQIKSLFHSGRGHPPR